MKMWAGVMGGWPSPRSGWVGRPSLEGKPYPEQGLGGLWFKGWKARRQGKAGSYAFGDQDRRANLQRRAGIYHPSLPGPLNNLMHPQMRKQRGGTIQEFVQEYPLCSGGAGIRTQVRVKATCAVCHLSAGERLRRGCCSVDMGVFETHPRLIRCHGCKINSRLHWLASLEPDAVRAGWVRTGQGSGWAQLPTDGLPVARLCQGRGRRCQNRYLCFIKWCVHFVNF